MNPTFPIVIFITPTTIIGNSLILIAIFRFKRLRSPSNYLLTSLATSDLAIGILLPLATFQKQRNTYVCLVTNCTLICLVSVSVLVIVAVAFDRFTSLAKPLRYNNLITHSTVERYILMFWLYSLLVGFTPLVYHVRNRADSLDDCCTFGKAVPKHLQLFVLCAVFGPSTLVLTFCYCYIYVIAKKHARAIQNEHRQIGTKGGSRYGIALAITSGTFLGLWTPFQICVLSDVFFGTEILSSRNSMFLAVPVLVSSASNPWVYGYRNSELRSAVRKVVDDLLTALGFTYRSKENSEMNFLPSCAATFGDVGSFIQHVQRDFDLASWHPNPQGDFLLVPIVRPETSISSGNAQRTTAKEFEGDEPNILISIDHPRILRNSKSMVESFAIADGKDILIVTSNKIKHGSSVL
ncbi:trace amine-associated receptor 1 [Aethina tumida]|uniref:trace amine-associated receptor 1 n=1 Tax=Aethina tumida TaxID=116153 RepID=UPI00096B4C80|nr:trace amine-associated receptor 1 [Aethina tumida]